MSWVNLEPLIERFPRDKETIQRLKKVLDTQNQNQLTIERYFDLVHPSSISVLSLILENLVADGHLQRIVRVRSPITHGGLYDYHSINEIPDEVDDWRAGGETFHVTPENIEILFTAKE